MTDAADFSRLTFSWEDLPMITADLPGTGGEIRRELDDFVVREVPAYLPSGGGDHAYALIEKRGLTTRELIGALVRRGVPRADVGAAGLKDKLAVTTQWLSVPFRYADLFEDLDNEEGVRVLETGLHRNKLGRGHLKGNRFEVRVRAAMDDWPASLNEVATRLTATGLPNFLGSQRFGRFGSNACDGARVARGERVPGGRGIQRFFIEALQSYAFNWLLKRRIELGLFGEVVVGDRAQRHDTGGVFVVEDAALESERAKRLEISAVLPLFGKRSGYSEHRAGDLEREALNELGLTMNDFRRPTGDRRISRVLLQDLSYEPVGDGYWLRFTLPAGAYATCLLREVTKRGDIA